jgi:riboflavin biosynthesis pyrimidine reductase
MNPIDCLFQREDLPSIDLPHGLAALYGGDFGVPQPGIYANFVASADGVVALPIAGESGAVISGHSEPDRFIMALLRAVADAVLIGAGTFRAGAGDLWLPETVFPEAADDFAKLRAHLGLRPRPLLVVVSGSGRIDLTQPALQDCLILTTHAGQAHLRGRLPEGARTAVPGPSLSRCQSWRDLLADQGVKTILCEGGPTVLGELLAARMVDELFLTTSPRLLGRASNDGRKSLVEGFDLTNHPMELLSLRRHQSHLFLRYGLTTR